jgi:cytochrome P450
MTCVSPVLKIDKDWKADSYAPMRVYVDGKSVGSIIDMQDEDQNRALKRAVGGAFILKSLVDYEDDVDTTLGALLQRIRQNPTFNLYETLQLFQLDFLIKIAFSETPGHLQQGADVLGLAKLGNIRVSHWFSWHAMPTLERFIFHSPIWGRWLARPSKWARMGAQRLQARQNVAINISEHTDLLQKCINASEKYPDVLRTQTVANLVNSIISAGADTTAGTMTTILYFLLKNPAKHQRLLQELDEARLQGRLSIPPRYTDVSGLAYLDAIIKEALRLNPPLAVPLERIVPEQGCFIDGLHIPGGAIIGCMAKVVHLDRTCYGPDAEKFRPERWLEAPKDQGIAMERGFLSWGSGNRICLGRHIAELEMKKVIPSLLLSFNVSLYPEYTARRHGLADMQVDESRKPSDGDAFSRGHH